MEIFNERNQKEIRISELDCGDLFTTRYNKFFYLKSSMEKIIEDAHYIECINIDDGSIEMFSLDKYIIPVKAKVVLT